MSSEHREEISRRLCPSRLPWAVDDALDPVHLRTVFDLIRRHGPWDTILKHHFASIEELIATTSGGAAVDPRASLDYFLTPTFRGFFAEALASGGALVAVDRVTGEIIGSSRYFGYDAQRSVVEIGWTFLGRSYWGGRYNGEMKRLMLEHAFKAVERVIFIIGPENRRPSSQRSTTAQIHAGSVRRGFSSQTALPICQPPST